MSTVTLTIGPKTYTVACAEGEEAHVASLGAMIAEKYAMLGTARAPLEAQNLLFAALFLADELAEARREGTPTGVPAPAEAAPAPAPAEPDPDLLAEIAALRAENARLKAAPLPAPPQPDLFAAAATAEAERSAAAATLAARIAALAARAEAAAGALEALGQPS